MVLRTITGARTPVCLLTAIVSVEAVTPPILTLHRRSAWAERLGKVTGLPADPIVAPIKEPLPI